MKTKHIKLKAIIIILIVKIGFILTVAEAQKVMKFFEKGQYEKAEQYCDKMKGEKRNACYIELSEAFFKIENYEKAAEYYAETTISKDGFKKIADAYYDKKNFDKAIEFYEKAFEDDKEKIEEYYNKIADAYLQHFDIENAKVYYLKAENSFYNENIGDFYFEQKNYEKAIEYYKENLEFYKKKYRSYSNIMYKPNSKLANAYFESKKYSQAGDHYEDAHDLEGMEKTAKAFFEEKEYRMAAYYYSKAYEDEKEKKYESFKKIADAFYNEQKYMDAAEYYRKSKYPELEKECYLKGKLVDIRDGKSYKIVVIGDEVWMAENLAYRHHCLSYINESDNDKYGYLYNWENADKICPRGWHLPSKEEFEELINNYGGDYTTDARNALIPGGASGFKAKYGGQGDTNSDYEFVGRHGFFWSSTENDENYAWSMVVFGDDWDIGSPGTAGMNNREYKGYFYSVRCIKD